MVIEDAALSFYGKYKNKYLGTFGDVGVFILWKQNNYYREGGLATCSKSKYFKKFKMLKNYGRLKEFINMKLWIQF